MASETVSRFAVVRDGLRLHYSLYGANHRPPLLCLHGLTRNSRDFKEFAERYEREWRVIALDFRGRGLSDYDPLPARYTPPTYAADVLQLLDQLSIDEAVFAGTSLGGLVTMIVAALAPQRIRAAILNDVGPELTAAGLDRIKTYVGKDVRFASWDEAADAITANNGHVPASYSHADWVKVAHRACREREGAIVYDYDMAIVQPFEALGAVPKVDMWSLFEALARKSLLVVRGEHSDLLSAGALERMQELVPDMTSVTVPGVGHAPTLDEPEAVEAIDRFLGSLSLDGSRRPVTLRQALWFLQVEAVSRKALARLSASATTGKTWSMMLLTRRHLSGSGRETVYLDSGRSPVTSRSQLRPAHCVSASMVACGERRRSS